MGGLESVVVLPPRMNMAPRALTIVWSCRGGEGSVGRWYHARPRLFSPDFRHATPAGYAIIGNMYYQALLKAFADHLAKH